MDFVIQWFGLLKLTFSLIFVIAIVYAFKYNWAWYHKVGLIIILSMLVLFKPIKLDTKVRSQQLNSNQIVETTKDLPEKVFDTSWKSTKDNTTGIKPKDLK